MHVGMLFGLFRWSVHGRKGCPIRREAFRQSGKSPALVIMITTTGLIYTVNDVRLFSWAGKNRPADAPESSDQSTSTKHRDLDHIQVVSSTVHVFGNDDAK
jgi:hypothetical protein